MLEFTVKVINNDNLPVESAKVELRFIESPLLNSIILFTDKFGEAIFWGYDRGGDELFINDKFYGLYYYNLGEGITVKI
ncbi:MAG: hypothetical protein N2319_08895 [Candidatus Kapabacteria bacterium]|nr:hypothetical protein [Candidatus Kapabacteria bacterium]